MKQYAHSPTWTDQEKDWLKEPEFVIQASKAEPEYQLARSLIQKRLKKGLTQAQLAKKAKTSQSAIARMESGGHSVSLSFLKKIAHALGASVTVSVS